MKKFLILTCLLACLFGVTACGAEGQLDQYDQERIDGAVDITVNKIIPTIQMAMEDEAREVLESYTPAEVEYVVSAYHQLNVDGRAFMSALDSFKSAYEELGGSGKIVGTAAQIDGDQIIVNVDVLGADNTRAKAEVVVSNDFFYTLESASLNKVSGIGESMGKAGLNTLLGMGTVFAVLILICLIISCFGIIHKLQMRQTKKGEAPAQTAGIDNAVAQITRQEEEVEPDDLELVAVIAAAVAASEGATSTDGFVVRSIKRRRVY